MEIRLEVDVPVETLGELRRLKNRNLLGSVAIDQACGMYPWVDQLFEKLCSKAGSILSKHQIRGVALMGLEVEVPMNTLEQLKRLEQTDLPGFVAIDQVRSMYSWVDQLFGELSKKANVVLSKYHKRVLYYSLLHDDVDVIYQQASADMFLDNL